jgi:hypothetical protein
MYNITRKFAGSVLRESLRQAEHLFASLLHTALATG